MRTGDLLLFSTNTTRCRHTWSDAFLCCLGLCIKCCTQSEFTHCGVVIVNPSWDPLLKGTFVLESTGLENVPDAEDHQVKFGVQLRRLEEVLNHFDGHVGLRSVQMPRDQRFENSLRRAHSLCHNRPYDVLPRHWLAAATHQRSLAADTTHEFFCSALVAFVYVEIGLLPRTYRWTTCTPAELAEHDSMPWLFTVGPFQPFVQ